MKSDKKQIIFEKFEDKVFQNGCHHMCSSMNWMNIVIVILFAVLFYMFVMTDKKNDYRT
jgi:hypothetical protein